MLAARQGIGLTSHVPCVGQVTSKSSNVKTTAWHWARGRRLAKMETSRTRGSIHGVDGFLAIFEQDHSASHLMNSGSKSVALTSEELRLLSVDEKTSFFPALEFPTSVVFKFSPGAYLPARIPRGSRDYEHFVPSLLPPIRSI